MIVPSKRDWLEVAGRHTLTDVYERALRAASGIIWQRMGHVAAGNITSLGHDYFDPSRAVIAQYLRHTGRIAEAQEVEAIGCNEPPPPAGFGNLSPTELAALRQFMGG